MTVHSIDLDQFSGKTLWKTTIGRPDRLGRPLSILDAPEPQPSSALRRVLMSRPMDAISEESSDLPNIMGDAFAIPGLGDLEVEEPSHPPRILILYGSLRRRSYSRFLAMEAERLLQAFGAEVRVFNPSGLPLPTMRRWSIPRSRNCATCRHGRRDRCGAAPSDTGR